MTDTEIEYLLHGTENHINQKLIESMDGCGYISVVDAVKIVSDEFELARAFEFDKKDINNILNVNKRIEPSDFNEIYEALIKEITR